MPDRALDKIMVATEPAEVATLAMVEALRAMADGQKQMSNGLVALQAEAREQAAMTRDVRERVIKIEAAAVDAKIDRIVDEQKEDRKRIDALEAERDRMDGAIKFANTLRIWVPALVVLVGVVLVFLQTSGNL